MNLEKEIFDIALEDIMPNRFQPREMFDEQALNELASSIKEHGVVQPITVRKVGDKYEIIAGERRFRASKLAGKKTVPALVKNYDDKEAAKVALIENLQRKDLTPIEEARTYQTILKLDNLTQEELANDLGKSQSTVANKLRLLNLDDTVQTALLNEKISERHARSLLNIENKEEQRRLLEKTIQDRLTVRQLDELIAIETGKIAPKTEQSEDIAIDDNAIFEKEDNKENNIKPEVNVIPEKVAEKEFPKEVNKNEVIENKKLNDGNVVLNKPETPIMNPTLPETPLEKPVEAPQQLNIFERLRQNEQPVPTEELTATKSNAEPINHVDIQSLPNQTETLKESVNNHPYGDIYDLRFAINNVRQAIQNTEKFGFHIQSDEFDFENVYQIIIKIDKEKPEQKA